MIRWLINYLISFEVGKATVPSLRLIYYILFILSSSTAVIAKYVEMHNDDLSYISPSYYGIFNVISHIDLILNIILSYKYSEEKTVKEIKAGVVIILIRYLLLLLFSLDSYENDYTDRNSCE
jgi:hypothetical protein